MAVANPSPSERAARVFELYGFLPSFEVDQAELESRLRQASLAWHPDRFALQGGDAQQEAEDKMAEFNEAFPLLRDAEKRAELLLNWLGVAPTQGTDTEAGPEFLMRMMELREEAEVALQSATSNPQKLHDLVLALQKQEREILTRFAQAFAALPESLRRCNAADRAGDAPPDELKDLRRMFYELRYYQRTREQLDTSLRNEAQAGS